MKNYKVRIGILGGFGPLASEDFLRKLLYNYIKATGAKYDCDFPEILYFSTYLNSFSEKGVLNRIKVKKELERKLNILIKNKVNIIFIICMSVMNILEDIELPKSVRIMNLVDITNDYLKNKIFINKNILVLSSDYTRRNKLFKQNNYSLIYINSFEQKEVDKLILSAMANTKISYINFLQRLNNHYKPDFILLGCTELPLIFSSSSDNGKIKIIDPLDLIIKKFLKYIKSKSHAKMAV